MFIHERTCTSCVRALGASTEAYVMIAPATHTECELELRMREALARTPCVFKELCSSLYSSSSSSSNNLIFNILI